MVLGNNHFDKNTLLQSFSYDKFIECSVVTIKSNSQYHVKCTEKKSLISC